MKEKEWHEMWRQIRWLGIAFSSAGVMYLVGKDISVAAGVFSGTFLAAYGTDRFLRPRLEKNSSKKTKRKK